MFTRKPKEGMIRIVLLAGQEWRGTVYSQDQIFDVSENYAEHLITEGKAKRHEEK